MAQRQERGMATAEYAVGTVGAVLIGLVIHKLAQLGIDGPWFAELAVKVRHALSWPSVLDHLPGFGRW